eukprot:TRINITY_DN4895_c0_g1_i1.p1 TRINITY_DN4895_c0_g1~~TRINITY_DN4895_c0_g1_i1.p1  ORF type:complete len:241 (-),score=22.33 TRINITY_DN4895_c0_g1_i1:9-731(-)
MRHFTILFTSFLVISLLGNSLSSNPKDASVEKRDSYFKGCDSHFCVHGTCDSKRGTCKCNEGYEGLTCECPTNKNSTEKVCSGNGKCNSNHACECAPGFVGYHCECNNADCNGLGECYPEYSTKYICGCVGPWLTRESNCTTINCTRANYESCLDLEECMYCDPLNSGGKNGTCAALVKENPNHCLLYGQIPPQADETSTPTNWTNFVIASVSLFCILLTVAILYAIYHRRQKRKEYNEI